MAVCYFRSSLQQSNVHIRSANVSSAVVVNPSSFAGCNPSSLLPFTYPHSHPLPIPHYQISTRGCFLPLPLFSFVTLNNCATYIYHIYIVYAYNSGQIEEKYKLAQYLFFNVREEMGIFTMFLYTNIQHVISNKLGNFLWTLDPNVCSPNCKSGTYTVLHLSFCTFRKRGAS